MKKLLYALVLVGVVSLSASYLMAAEVLRAATACACAATGVCCGQCY